VEYLEGEMIDLFEGLELLVHNIKLLFFQTMNFYFFSLTVFLPLFAWIIYIYTYVFDAVDLQK
jgi:hypothetical protein